MKVVIAGASGFIGRNLSAYLSSKGIETIPLDRLDFTLERLQEKIEGSDMLINLAGTSIAGIWTGKRKRAIYNSRISSTKALVKAVIACKIPVGVFVHVSGVGLYHGEGIHDENSTEMADNFLKRVIIDWEKALHELDGKCGRVVILRLGAVLDKNGGMLAKLKLLRYLGIGFGVKSEEGFAFIHIKDLLRIFDFIINYPEMKGVYNGVSPEINSISTFYRLLARAFKYRFTILVNARLAKVFLGESVVMVSKGQRVVPLRLLKEGFVFEFTGLEESLFHLLQKN
jgi:uncharacterized protein (TIGR01777 family)